MFERSVVWNLTSGVSLSMSYSVASQPYLRAEFRCNNHKVTLDPALDWLWPDHAPADSAVDLADQFRSLYLEIASDSRRKEPEEYRDEALTRHLELLETYRGLERQPMNGIPITTGWSLSRTSTDGFEQPVDLLLQKRLFVPAVPRQAASTVAAARIAGLRDDSLFHELLAETCIVILCGGLMNKADRELVDPGYGLDIDIGGGKTDRMSILEWRLHQLNHWVRHVGEYRLPVLLLTTPETENVVDGCCKKFRKRCGLFHPVDRLEINQVAVQLIPWVETVDGQIHFHETADGGWRLSPRGHMDALRILAERSRLTNRNGESRGKKFAIIFAFNNLGELIDDLTYQNLAELADSGGNLAVELFDYQSRNDDESRWSQLSYCVSADRTFPVLMKPPYPTGSVADGEERYYSSLTWYVAVSKLGRPMELDAELADLGFVRHAGALAGQYVLGQDIDMITHCDRFNVRGLEPGPGKDPASSPYRHRRYLGVRTKDHIRQREFGEEFKDVGGLTSSMTPQSGPDDRPPPRSRPGPARHRRLQRPRRT